MGFNSLELTVWIFLYCGTFDGSVPTIYLEFLGLSVSFLLSPVDFVGLGLFAFLLSTLVVFLMDLLMVLLERRRVCCMTFRVFWVCATCVSVF